MAGSAHKSLPHITNLATETRYAMSNRNAHPLPIDGELDLHTFSPRDVKSVVEEYVEAAIEIGLTEIRVIHGRGSGVQRSIVHAVLARHPLVMEFSDAPESKLGATLARLDPAGLAPPK